MEYIVDIKLSIETEKYLNNDFEDLFYTDEDKERERGKRRASYWKLVNDVLENKTPHSFRYIFGKSLIDDSDKAIKQLLHFEEQYKIDGKENVHQKVYLSDEIDYEKNVGKTIYVLGYPISIRTSPEEFEDINGDTERQTLVSLSVLDTKDKIIGGVSWNYEEYKNEIEFIKRTESLILFVGTVVSIIPQLGIPYYDFLIKSIKEKVTPLELIADRDYSENELKQKIEYYNKKEYGGVRKYIKSELVNNIGIKGLGNAKELDKAIDFMIIQSFSQGMSRGNLYLNKLHSLIIGPPSSGKKLLTVIAKILNPIAFEVTANKSKVTSAGLIGRVVKRGSESISIPGYIPMASKGIVCIQDFHEFMKRNDGRGIMASFSQFMEDGRLTDSTSAMTDHTATTSLHIDMNRLSQVSNVSDKITFEDLNIPKNILSRFDFIMDIPQNNEMQTLVSDAMLEHGKIFNTMELTQETPEWAKKLKRIVAYILTNYQTSTMKSDVAQYLKNKLHDYLEEKADEFGSHIEIEMLTPRLINSLEKFAKAIVCSKLKTNVEKDDIDEVFSFVKYKLDFLINYKDANSASQPVLGKKEIRQNLILELLPNEFKNQDLKDLVENGDLKDSLRTLQRDIKELVQSGKVENVEHDSYKIVVDEENYSTANGEE